MSQAIPVQASPEVVPLRRGAVLLLGMPTARAAVLAGPFAELGLRPLALPPGTARVPEADRGAIRLVLFQLAGLGPEARDLVEACRRDLPEAMLVGIGERADCRGLHASVPASVAGSRLVEVVAAMAGLAA